MIEVRVYGPTGVGAFVVIPRRRAVAAHEAFAGLGSFEIPVGDQVLVDNPGLLAHRKVVKFFYEGAERFAFRIDRRRTQVVSTQEAAGKWIRVQGLRVDCLLGDLVNYPEYGLTRTSGDERRFFFGSKVGDWYVSADWVAPLGVRWDADTTARAKKPADWPDGAAQWIWPTSPTVSLPGGEVAYFRTTLVVGTPQVYRIFATADNVFELFLDGEPILASDPAEVFAWKSTRTFDVDLAAGSHVLAARVENTANLDGATNPAGFMCTIATLNSKGEPAQFVRRSETTNWLCHDDTPVPGWRAAHILTALLVEGQTRNVAAADVLTLGFTSTTDSDGVAWDDRQDLAVRVAFESLQDVAAKLVESSIDVAVGPDMVLRAWKSRGTDRTTGLTPVTLTTGVVVDHAVTSTAPRATRMLARSGQGWVEVVDAAAETAHGRIEAGVQLGGARSLETAQSIIESVFAETAAETTDVESGRMPALPGTTPYVDFGIGDDVLTLGEDGTLIPVRVDSWHLVEDQEARVFFTPVLYA